MESLIKELPRFEKHDRCWRFHINSSSAICGITRHRLQAPPFPAADHRPCTSPLAKGSRSKHTGHERVSDRAYNNTNCPTVRYPAFDGTPTWLWGG
jgi:hypothetical protein